MRHWVALHLLVLRLVLLLVLQLVLLLVLFLLAARTVSYIRDSPNDKETGMSNIEAEKVTFGLLFRIIDQK